MDAPDYFKQQRDRIDERREIERIIAEGTYCPICGNVLEPFDLENHHIAGRRNSDIIVPVCKICHDRLTAKQRCWPEEWTFPDNDPLIRRAFMLRGLSDILILSSRELRKASTEILLSEGMEG